MPKTNIVILGGGVGGTMTANLLSRKLTRREAQVTLIDQTGRHVYQPGWLYVPFGGDPPEAFERDERRLLNKKVKLVVGTAERIDHAARQVLMDDGTAYPYDYLVIATGARNAPEAVPGFAEGAHHFYSPEGALRLHAALREFKGGKIVIGVADIPYRCPPAPLEFTFMLNDYLKQHGLREKTEITYLSPINRVFTIESVSKFVTPMLEERDIKYETFFNTEEINPEARTISSLEGTSIDYDLLVLTPPHRGAQLIVNSGLGDAQGWVPTDRETLQSKADARIYVLGDASDLPVSKSGSAAHFEAKVVVARLVGEVHGKPNDIRYTGEVMCFIETGEQQATQIIFDYNNAPQPPQPRHYYHFEKALFNKAYWYLVPQGLV